jgi:hypothetical protein
MGRSTVKLRCPGTTSNYTVLVSTAWQAKYGLGNPKNVGSCDLFIHALDQDGEVIQKDRRGGWLVPGQSLPWYYPPPGAVQLVAVCNRHCSEGDAVLEYDTPDN